MPKGEKMLAPLTLRSMSDIETAWIGAIFEGEGSIRYVGDRDHTWRSLGMQVVNTDPEILSALLRVTGVGSVYAKETGKLGTRPCFQWVLQQRANALALLTRIAPYSMKAQRAIA